jgi:hypothetical protein
MPNTDNPPMIVYPERIRIESSDTPTMTVLDAFRHGKNGHLWLEMTGDPPEFGDDALLGIALNREQAALLGAMIARMLAEQEG